MYFDQFLIKMRVQFKILSDQFLTLLKLILNIQNITFKGIKINLNYVQFFIINEDLSFDLVIALE